MKKLNNFKAIILLIIFIFFTNILIAQKQKYHRISASVKPEVLKSLFEQGLSIDHFSYEQDLVLTAEVSDDDIDIFKKNNLKFIYII
jgi:hypothetical protein